MKKANGSIVMLLVCCLLSACLGEQSTETVNNTKSVKLIPSAIASETESYLLPTATVKSITTVSSEPVVLPTSTISSTPCDLVEFVADVTVPDGTVFHPNESFTKTWQLRNIGSCTWTTNYELAFEKGDAMTDSVVQKLSSEIAPGQTVDISVNLSSPAQEGSFRGYWKLLNASGAKLSIQNGSTDSLFYVDIAVTSPATTFIVTIDTLVVTCDKPDYFTATATISSTGPGSAVYNWSTDGYQPYPSATVSFEQASTMTISADIPFSMVDPKHPEWNKIYLSFTSPSKNRIEVLRQCP